MSDQTVKNLPAMQETWVQSLGQEDPLEKGMATHSSVLAWRIPWTEEPTAGYSPWDCKKLDTIEQLTLSLFFYFLWVTKSSQSLVTSSKVLLTLHSLDLHQQLLN